MSKQEFIDNLDKLEKKGVWSYSKGWLKKQKGNQQIWPKIGKETIDSLKKFANEDLINKPSLEELIYKSNLSFQQSRIEMLKNLTLFPFSQDANRKAYEEPELKIERAKYRESIKNLCLIAWENSDTNFFESVALLFSESQISLTEFQKDNEIKKESIDRAIYLLRLLLNDFIADGINIGKSDFLIFCNVYFKKKYSHDIALKIISKPYNREPSNAEIKDFCNEFAGVEHTREFIRDYAKEQEWILSDSRKFKGLRQGDTKGDNRKNSETE